ncbi:unnamed protein product [Amoebophrya sp. A120]|nr:unnamed protein product [Amoebophrya sp. A120]|eukprot:GSA120T00017849001.1
MNIQDEKMGEAAMPVDVTAANVVGGLQILPVALAGFGTVGCGVLELMLRNNKKFATLYGFQLKVEKILVRSPAKHIENIRSDKFLSSAMDVSDQALNALFTTNLADFQTFIRPQTVLIELIGGCTDAKQIVYDGFAKMAGSVITANKALIYGNLAEISNLSCTPQYKNFFGFEAAVCGGIPIINTVTSDFVSDEIQAISGIMNGTTNFILSKMEVEGVAYPPVLKEAQELGYAEADPTADVEGYDARDKIGILAKLAFGVALPSIPCKGISAIEKTDFDAAKTLLNSSIKLLAVAKKTGSGGVSCFVWPHLVPFAHPIASCRGPTNLVTVTSRNMGDSVFVGPGAGRYPTANSVMNDVVKAGQMIVSKSTPPALLKSSGGDTAQTEAPFEPDFPAKGFYLRCGVPGKDPHAAASALGIELVKVDSTFVIGQTILITGACNYSKAAALAKEVDCAHAYPVYG